MNSTRIDSLSRKLADGSLTRRSTLKHGVVGLAAVAGKGLAGRAAAQDATPTSDGDSSVELLFVQSGGSTTFAPGDGGIHTLTLMDITGQTLYFSDRPARMSGTVPTDAFVATWSDVFGDDPPNATLIGHLEDGEEAVVIELIDAEYDADTDSLTYAVELLDLEEIGDQQFEHEPLSVLDSSRTYTEAHVFIDASDWCLACAAGLELSEVCLPVCDALT